MEKLKQLGIKGSILTYARETVFDHSTNTEQAQGTVAPLAEKKNNTVVEEIKSCPNIEAWRKGTLETIDLIDEGDYLALRYGYSIFCDSNLH